MPPTRLTVALWDDRNGCAMVVQVARSTPSIIMVVALCSFVEVNPKHIIVGSNVKRMV